MVLSIFEGTSDWISANHMLCVCWNGPEFGITHRGTKEKFLVLCSVVSPGDIQGTIYGIRDSNQGVCDARQET